LHSPAEQLEMVIQRLSNLAGPSLLVIDNANDQEELAAHYQHLSRLPNFHILVTTRVSTLANACTLKIAPLSEDHALQLFDQYYRNPDDHDNVLLVNILTAINRNTLIIELLAKNLREKNKFRTVYSLQQLLADLQQKGLLLVNTTTVDTQYQNFVAAKPTDIIRAMYDIHSLSILEKSILNNFSVLPAERIPYALLVELLNPSDADAFDEALNQLSLKGWIDFDPAQKAFKVSQVIQEVMLDANSAALHEDCRALLNKLLDNLQKNHQYALSGRFAASVIDSLGIRNMELAVLCNYAADYYYSLDHHFEAEKLALLVRNFIKGKPETKEFLYIKYYNSYLYANVMEALDNYTEAGEYYREVSNLSSTLNLSFDKVEYALYKSKVGRFAEAEPVLYQHYMTLKKQQAADPAQTDASALALAAHNLARVLRSQERYDEAIPYHEESIQLYQQLYGPGHEYVAIVQLNLAKTLIAQKQDLAQARSLLTGVLVIFSTTYEEGHLHLAHYYFAEGELCLAHKDMSGAIDHFQQAEAIYSRKSGPTCKNIIEARIVTGLLARELAKENKITQEQYQTVVTFLEMMVSRRFVLLINRFSIYNPLLHKLMELVAHVYTSQGETDKAVSLHRRREEFLRISYHRTAIRVDLLEQETLSEADKNKYFHLFKATHSLPAQVDQVELEKFVLPFYKTFNLFKIIYKNTSRYVKQYALSDGQTCYAINYTNGPIYDINEKDAHITRDNIYVYVDFFCDAVCGMQGFFYTVRDDKELPWRVDNPVTEAEKEKIVRKIRDRTLIADNAQEITIQTFIVFTESLFLSHFTVHRDGRYQSTMPQSRLCTFREGHDLICLYVDDLTKGGKYIYYDYDNNRITIPDDGATIDKIPACIELDYYNYYKMNPPKS